MTLRQLARDEYGCETVAEFLNEYCQDATVPAVCEEGCEVEPDGVCEHGKRSALLVAGLV